MKNSVIKSNAFWMLVISFFALSSSYGFEYFFQLNPCPLCIMQRFASIMLMFFILIYFVSDSWPKRLNFWIMIWLFVALGLSSALRQLWLQLFETADSSLCMPGFEELIQFFSWDTVLKMLFWGSNDCSTISWTLMGMPMSVWSLGYFVIILILSIREWLVVRR
jgi:disulfide bond formation protein DsbB